MAIMERWIHKVTEQSAWETILENEKKWDAIEERLGGFSRKRRYRPIAGAEDSTKFIWEREWESMTALEAGYKQFEGDDEVKELSKGLPNLIDSIRREIFEVLD